jgi:glycosyltransferase involved in cell wall biosynthesis
MEALMNPEISVIIPAYANGEQLQACLEALERQVYPPAFEVIVVDNGSTPPLQIPERPGWRVVREERIGSYAARNHGVANARGQFLVFIDTDCIPELLWLRACKERLTRESGIVIGGHIETVYEDPEAPRAVEIFDKITTPLDQKSYVERWNFAATANLAIRKADFDRVGPFCADLKSYGDREWCHRAIAAGLRLVYADEAVVNHRARRTVSGLIRREVRLTGGSCDTRMRAGVKRRTFFREGLRLLLPDRGIIENGWRFWRMGTEPVTKIKLLTLVFFMRYCHALEKLRLSLGGVSQRG